MPCFRPLVASRLKYKNGSFSAPIFGLIDRKTFPESIKIEEIALPCGRCIGCRLERSRMWAMRCVFEAKEYSENSFITLTYDSEHCPPDFSLKKRDFQLFMKRLRESIAEDCRKKGLPEKKIRFFGCGEYGEKTFRPHYHAIIFNHKFDDEREEVRHTADGLKKVLVSPKLTKIWGKGITATGEMTFSSAAYVARYCLKKINGPDADFHYMGREPEFSLMSRMPGIGFNWFKKYKNSIFSNDFCMIRGKKCKPPPYFDKCLQKVDEELFKLVKSKRVPLYDPKTFMTGDNSFSRLFDREQVANLRLKKIKRGL